MKVDNLDYSLNLNGPEKKKISFHKKELSTKPDSVEISDKAKTLQDKNGKAVKFTEVLGAGLNYSIKDKKVEQAKANLDSGLYEKQEYKEKTADKLISSSELKDIAYNLDSLKEANQNKEKSTKIEEIRQKIASGFYNRAEVLDEIAKKLTKEFGFE
jgi:anti-sigma28 factor (negative regulator of flagellin synthesis)